MKIVVEIMAEAITNKLTKLAICNGILSFLNKMVSHYLQRQSLKLKWPFLPPEIHPDMESGMGMATKPYLGTDSSWLKVEIVQIKLEQVRK